jgi:hypothetical protein
MNSKQQNKIMMRRNSPFDTSLPGVIIIGNISHQRIGD